MDAELDLLLIAVYWTVDDLLPRKAANARRRITDQEVITLCIAQALLDCRSDEQFLAIAARRLAHLFPRLPERSAFRKRRLRLSAVIEGLIAEFARHSPGFYDELVLVDSTPVECARSVETTRRSQPRFASRSTSNSFSGAAKTEVGCCPWTRCSGRRPDCPTVARGSRPEPVGCDDVPKEELVEEAARPTSRGRRSNMGQQRVKRCEALSPGSATVAGRGGPAASRSRSAAAPTRGEV